MLRNPWIQWTVLLPRELDDPRYAAIRDVGPAAVRALGVRDGLTHMEWFRRPDGTVAVSEVGARPPGAQLSSMLGYVHDVDFYRTWCELVLLDRFDPPERKYASGCVYLRGQGPQGRPARSGPCTASRSCSAASGTWSSRPGCPRPASRRRRTTRGRAT